MSIENLKTDLLATFTAEMKKINNTEDIQSLCDFIKIRVDRYNESELNALESESVEC